MRNPEFQALWLGHAVSMAGNNLLTIAVAILVYQQTSSALAAGFTLALTFLPQIVGGPLLSGLADRFPRRRIMIASDLLRAALIPAIGFPGLPLWAIWTLLFLAILPIVPFGAARAALLTEIVLGDRYVAGSAIINLTSQGGALVGLLLGGAVITVAGASQTLLFNGLAFAVSAAVVAAGVRSRPAPGRAPDRPGMWAVPRDGALLVFGDPRLRALVLLSWLAGFYVVPLGVAAPLADEMSAGPAAVSVIMAAVPAGALVGGFVLTRLVSPASRMHLIGPLAVMASLPLLGLSLQPPLWVLALLLVVSGMCGAYQFVANAAFVLCVPAAGRGLAFGLAAAGLQAAQGIGILIGGLLVDGVGAHTTVALAGVGGVLCAAALIPAWNRVAFGVVERLHEPDSAG